MKDLAYLYQITSADITNPEIRSLHEQVIDNSRADFTFTTFVEGNRDETMTEQKAEDIITLMPEGDFRLQATFIKSRNGGWVIEKGRAPLRASGNRGLVTLNRDMNPNVLVAIDMLFYEVSYPVSVVIYEAFEITTPNVNNLRPMRHPGNCVAKLVRAFF